MSNIIAPLLIATPYVLGALLAPAGEALWWGVAGTVCVGVFFIILRVRR